MILRAQYRLLHHLRPISASLRTLTAAPKAHSFVAQRPRKHNHFCSTSANMPTTVKQISTPKACPPAGPYTQAIVAGNTIYVSGQIPADTNGQLVEGSIADKTGACALNIKAILEEAGFTLGNVVKTLVFLDDMANFAEMNAEYEKFFKHRPARSCVAVKTLPKGVPVEIECVAVV